MKPVSIDTMFNITVIVGIYIAILVGIAVAAEQFGFFRMASGTFIAIYGVVPCLVWFIGPAWIHRVDLRRLLQQARPPGADSLNGIAGSNGEGGATPPVNPQLPSKAVLPTRPATDLGSSPASIPAGSSSSGDLAGLGDAWSAAADPLPMPIRPALDVLGLVPLRSGADVAVSSSVSPFVAIENGFGRDAVRELWDLRIGRSAKRLAGVRLSQPTILSSDGRQLAGRASVGQGIEVWSFDNNAPVLSVPDEGFGGQFAFAGPDRLVTFNSVAGKYRLTVWNVATGQAIQQIENLAVVGSHAIAISPGGKFFVCGTSEQLELFDLDAGHLLARVPLPAGSGRRPEIRGLCFSADGELLAGLFAEFGRVRIVCWKFADATVLADGEMVVTGAESVARGQANIQFLVDKSGWLINQHILVPFREENTAWSQTAQGGGGKVSIVGGHVVDKDHLLVWNREALTVFRLPRDASGKGPWQDGPVALESLITSTRPIRPSGASAGAADKVVSPQSPSGIAASADATVEKQTSMAVRDIYSSLIVGDGKQLEQRMRWYPAGKRPSIGMRWGLGVELPGRNSGAPIRSLGELAQATGSIGPDLFDLLQQQSAAGKFGDWPKPAEPQLADVTFLGDGKLAELKTAARRRELNMLLVIEMDSQLVAFTKKWRTTLTVKIVDVDAANPPWTSESLSASQVAAGLKSGTDPRAEFVQTVSHKIASDYMLVEIPALTKDMVKLRVADIGRSSADNPMPLLAELRYYQSKSLAEPADLDPVYDRLLGPGGARKMLQGNAAERRQAVDALFK